MSQNLNRVRIAGLVRRGQDGMVALHLHFERPHDGSSLGVFYRELGDSITSGRIIPMVADVHRDHDAINLVPISPTGDMIHYLNASRQFGYDPPSGELPFLNENGCSPIEGSSRLPH